MARSRCSHRRAETVLPRRPAARERGPISRQRDRDNADIARLGCLGAFHRTLVLQFKGPKKSFPLAMVTRHPLSSARHAAPRGPQGELRGGGAAMRGCGSTGRHVDGLRPCIVLVQDVPASVRVLVREIRPSSRIMSLLTWGTCRRKSLAGES
jgi:hypothetical protein